MKKQFEAMFEPLQLKSGLSLKNRLVMAPMTNFSSHEDGTVSEEELAYYARRSEGVAAVITACTYVTPNGKGFPGEFAGDRDEMIPSLSRLAQTIQSKGAKAILQIFHGGRMTPPDLVGGDVVSASEVPAEAAGSPVPRALSSEEVEHIVEAFGDTTRRAIEAGYDGVEIHGANGYLIQQFFSPHSNRRTDKWGERLAFPLAVVDAVQKAAAAAGRPFAVGYRFSPEEPETPGITMADTLELIDALKEKNLDYLHASLMEYWSKPRRGVEEDRPRLELIKKQAGGTPVIGVGSVYTAEDAQKAFETGIDLLAVGRGLIIEPDWVQKVASGQENTIALKIDKGAQEKLVVPDALWNAIIQTPGWFPGV